MRWLYFGGGALALILLMLGLSAFANWQGWTVRATDQDIHAARLAEHMRISLPEGDGPFPTVLQFHGCGSSLSSQDDWAAFLNEHGYGAIIVDSLGPRDISREEALTSVCTGFQLTSIERAGDIIAAVRHAKTLPAVDADNLFVAGWSHGGWSIMDLLTLDLPDEVPPNLTAASWDDLSGVRGAVLIYPYCGFPSRSEPQGWQHMIPATVFMGDIDPIAPARDCMRAFERLREDGADIETRIFEGADHDYDVSRHEAFHRDRFNEEATAETREAVLSFLQSHLDR